MGGAARKERLPTATAAATGFVRFRLSVVFHADISPAIF
jgi:hypothetical protein